MVFYKSMDIVVTEHCTDSDILSNTERCATNSDY